MMTLEQKRARRMEREAAKARHDEYIAKARAVVATGKCPVCGAGIHRNLSLTGWWQCDRFGSPGFRKDETGPECNWQVFTG